MIHSRRPLRVALVGIDGCGKTTVAERLRDDPNLVVLHTIHPHETVNGPFHELSQHLDSLSVVADRLRCPQLKVAAYYLLLRTYAPSDRFLTHAFAPHIILSDRHPLIDALVYLPIYRQAATASAARVPDWRGQLEPDTHRAILAWANQIEGGHDLWALGHRLLSLHLPSRDSMLVALSGMLHTTLPDVVIHLDLDVNEALRRLAGCRQNGELHETATWLSQVRARYDTVLAWLAQQPAPVTVRRIECGAGRSVEDIANETADHLGNRVLIAAA